MFSEASRVGDELNTCSSSCPLFKMPHHAWVLCGMSLDWWFSDTTQLGLRNVPICHTHTLLVSKPGVTLSSQMLQPFCTLHFFSMIRPWQSLSVLWKNFRFSVIFRTSLSEQTLLIHWADASNDIKDSASNWLSQNSGPRQSLPLSSLWSYRSWAMESERAEWTS